MKRHPTPAAPNTLQPGYYIFWRHRTYRLPQCFLRSCPFLARSDQFLGEDIDLFKCILQMRNDCCGQFIRFGHLIFGIVARISQPCDIEVVVPGCDLLSTIETKAPFLFHIEDRDGSELTVCVLDPA